MLSRRSVVPFLLGAGCMLMLVILLMWVLPRWLPAGGLVIRIGPNGGAATPVVAGPPAQGVASTPPAGTTTTPATAAPAIVPAAAPGSSAPPRDSAVPAAPAAARGQLLVPVRGITPAQLVDTYSQARGQGRVHDAIDIAAPRGAPVLATADGVVLKLFRSDRGGITLYELAPDRRTIYYYAHLERYAGGMADGRQLRQGDVIGYVGDTGNAGAGNYHLHFEISTTADPARYWAGTPQNPYPPLRAGIGVP
jgi:murein DD-endopeptidase MepM/ murein hydrolase activator NlpD